MPNPAPGFAKHPGYTVAIVPSRARVQVHVRDTLVADTRKALKLYETNLEPVWYVPVGDVDRGLLRKTQTSTYCPFKGHASYWSLATAHGLIEDALWSYEAPFDECASLQNHVAFYGNRVTIHAQDEG